MITRPPSAGVPDAPGSYQFLDAAGRVIYVGKALSLRKRLASYFQEPGRLAGRTRQMVEAAASVEWIEVRNEVEALVLEANLIKAHKPRFNVRMMDDKTYPYVAVTLGDAWPRVAVVREAKRKGVRYFGPYVNVGAIRQTVAELTRSMPIRTCSDAKLGRHEKLGRPCLLYHIERCSGPCVGAVTKEAYEGYVREMTSFLEGDSRSVVGRLTTSMHDAARDLDFERAARLRDRLAAVDAVLESQQMVSDRPEDFDVIAEDGDDLETAVQVFSVRRGMVVGRRAFVLDKPEDLTPAELVGRILESVYDEPVLGVPRLILVPGEPDSVGVYESWLAAKRGGPVRVSVPKRGAKRSLQETVRHNATQALARHAMMRASDHNSRARALAELQEILCMPEAPLRIECYDMSHLQGQDYVGSMVVLEDGIAKRSDYRRFRIRSVPGNDDYAAMAEVLERRLRRFLEDRGGDPGRNADPGRSADRGRSAGPEEGGAAAKSSGRPVRRPFAYPPQLIIVDGGKGQLAVAERVVQELGLAGRVSLASLAKRLEEVYVPGRSEPIIVARPSEALYLLQRARDESHRFAIRYHRAVRARRVPSGPLEGIRGLGPKRRERLVRQLGSARAVAEASLEDLREISWLPEDVAERIWDRLHA